MENPVTQIFATGGFLLLCLFLFFGGMVLFGYLIRMAFLYVGGFAKGKPNKFGIFVDLNLSDVIMILMFSIALIPAFVGNLPVDFIFFPFALLAGYFIARYLIEASADGRLPKHTFTVLMAITLVGWIGTAWYIGDILMLMKTVGIMAGPMVAISSHDIRQRKKKELNKKYNLDL